MARNKATSAWLIVVLVAVAVVGRYMGGGVSDTPEAPSRPSAGQVSESAPGVPHLVGEYRIGGVVVVDNRSGRAYRLGTVDIRPVLDRIEAGQRDEHRNDGSVYRNLSGALPQRPNGYYREYVVPTPGMSGPGPQRLVVGRDGEVYYTHDHYDTFVTVRVRP